MALNVGSNNNPFGSGSLNISTRAQGAATLNDLSDVTITPPLASGQVLIYDGNTIQWVNIAAPWKTVVAGNGISTSTAGVNDPNVVVAAKASPGGGIAVGTNGIAVDSTVVRTLTSPAGGIQTINSTLNINGDSTIDGDVIITGKLTVSGAGSVIDASTLDGEDGVFYQDATNLISGTLNAARLPTIAGLTAGTYGTSSLIPVITVDNKGRITAAATTSIVAADQSTSGIVRLATPAETTAGASSVIAVNPAGLASVLVLKANLASPAFTGAPTAPTAATNNNTTQLATTAFVNSAAVLKTGDTMTGTLAINNGSPTIRFQDTDHLTAFTHCNGNNFYILRGEINATTWTQINGQWPLTINLTNNDATFGGNVYAVSNVSAYSDIRLKTDIAVIPNALEKVNALQGVTYSRKDNGERQTGLIAQDVQAVLPEAVSTGPDNETLCVAYGNITGLLVEAIKELTYESKRQTALIEEQSMLIQELMQREIK